MQIGQWYTDVFLPKSLEITLNFVEFVKHYFSISRNVHTLFSPWKRQLAPTKTGISGKNVIDNISYNLVSRIVGFLIRSLTLITGITAVGIVVMLAVVSVFVLTITLVPVYWLYHKHQYLTTRFVLAPTAQQLTQELDNSGLLPFLSRRTGLDQNSLRTTLQNSRIDIKLLVNQTPVSEVSIFRRWLELDSTLPAVFATVGISNTEELTDILDWYSKVQQNKTTVQAFWSRENLLKIEGIGKDWSYGYTPRLNSLCRDLTKSAPNFEIIDRDTELDSLISGVTQEREPHTVIYGTPGVGRHSLVHKLVWAIENHKIHSLRHKRILVFETSRFLAQTTERQAPGLLREVLEEAEQAGNVILVIDDLDQLFVNQNETHDLSRVFEENLLKGELIIIGITNDRAFFELIQPNNNLMKLLTPIHVQELNRQQVLKILLYRLNELEHNLKIHITYQCAKHLVNVADQHISQGVMPEKMLDLLSKVASLSHKLNQSEITLNLIDQAAAKLAHVPIGAIEGPQKEQLLHLDEILSKHIVSQTEAIDKIVKALRRNQAGITRSHKPIGSFLFLGPTGVGKTHTAQTLSKFFFETEHISRIDMSEYQTADAVERLIGSSLHHSPGSLTTLVLDRPYGVLLLDEFEKAPTQVQNLFLTILDEGYFTSADNQKIDCRNLLIIATSNAGTQEIQESQNQEFKPDNISELVTNMLLENRQFSPELINRFDAVVVYRPLDETALQTIVHHKLDQIKDQLKTNKDITFLYDHNLVDQILKNGSDPTFGARAIDRYIQDSVTDQIAKAILQNPEMKEIRL